MKTKPLNAWINAQNITLLPNQIRAQIKTVCAIGLKRSSFIAIWPPVFWGRYKRLFSPSIYQHIEWLYLLLLDAIDCYSSCLDCHSFANTLLRTDRIAV